MSFQSNIIVAIASLSVLYHGVSAQSEGISRVEWSKIATVRVEVASVALESLRREPRLFVPAQVTIGMQQFTNAMVALRGRSSFDPADRQPSLAVKLDQAGAREWHGQTKVFLHSSKKDPSLIRQLLAGELFRAAGVPGPRVGHCRVVLNGRDCGLYSLVEAVNKPFLRTHFGNADGNLYEGDYCDIDQPLELDNGPGGTELQTLVSAAREPDPGTRWRRLGEVLDLEKFLSYVAIEMLIANRDGYTANHNNYRIYHDPKSRRMVFIPHGTESSFMLEGARLMPPTSQILLQAILHTPEGRAAYRARVSLLYSNLFDPAVLQQRVADIETRLTAVADTEQGAQIRQNAAAIRQWIAQAHSEFERQIAAGQPVRLDLGQGGTARLSGWRPVGGFGTARSNRENFDGRPALHVVQTNGLCVASWRTTALLEGGKYAFEGKGRVKDVRRGSSAYSGARLFIRSAARPPGMLADTGWNTLRYPFEVPPGGAEVEFICELWATRGECWFDEESLLVSRR